MGISSLQPTYSSDGNSRVNAQSERPSPRVRRNSGGTNTVSFSARAPELDAPQRHAELFYLQKQIQSQTPMVVVLEDGERIEGCIEWYDRNSLKVRGRSKTLIYKSAIKYMYKLGDVG
jgi:sRNA-binding regulator protein Hfq